MGGIRCSEGSAVQTLSHFLWTLISAPTRQGGECANLVEALRCMSTVRYQLSLSSSPVRFPYVVVSLLSQDLPHHTTPITLYTPQTSQKILAPRQSSPYQHHEDNTMSKFVEILDVADAPYSHENVTLEDTLAENRRRSESSSSASSSSDKSLSRERSPTTSPASPVRTRLRAFSLRKPKT